MRVFESLDIEEKFKNPVLTIGNYDGIHIGHRRIIERVKANAKALSGTSMLMTFNPHPLHILRPHGESAAIVPLAEKKRLIEEAGIEVLIIVPFTVRFAHLSPETFITSILVERLAIRGLVVGYDFRFGRQGRGDIALLEEAGHKAGFFVETVGPITLEGEKVGSNRIRRLVAEGDVSTAARLLGRPFAIEGTVVRALGRGRDIGYPTINLETDYSLIPKNGVYVTEVAFEGSRHGGLTNIGHNPTFEKGQKRSIETFILDFDGNLYERRVRLHFLARIRDEMKFETAEELKARIGADVEIGRALFKERAM
ncbi:MAG: bifunctional riboflavin kinase/FAD synthetase [Syntrophorhabdales bacterium]|jgi:riboflavin kinase/FMN adenylyltransferase